MRNLGVIEAATAGAWMLLHGSIARSRQWADACFARG
jgi:hypothetical protein